MRIVEPSIEFLWMTPEPLQMIERAGRTCYKSEDRITEESALAFVKMLIDRGHEAMIEHASMSCRLITDRGVTHEIVRHRLFSYAQESTRYCNYKKSGIAVIKPPFGITQFEVEQEDVWSDLCSRAEQAYFALLSDGASPQIARSVLPTCLKTEIVVTGNFREWRHFFALRTDSRAHPQMREIANMVLEEARSRVQVVFDV